MSTYNVKQTAEKLGITTRAVQKRCKFLDIRKVNNTYQITDEFINAWYKEIVQSNEQRTNQFANQLRNERTSSQLTIDTESLNTDITIENLKTDIEILKAEINIPDNYEGITHLDNGKTLLVFNAENSNLLDEKLIEWQEQKIEIQQHKKEIEKKDESFNKELASKDEIIIHYKTQFEYQREQSTKILDIHQKLVDTINIQAKSTQERNLIEAVEKDIIDKNTHKPKSPQK